MTVFRVRIEGNDVIARKFGNMRVKVSDLSEAFQRIGEHIKRDAIPLTPVLSGALANTLRVGKAKSMTVVRAGNARVVYAGVQHYGGYHNIEAKPFLTTALEMNKGSAQTELENEIERIVRRVGL